MPKAIRDRRIVSLVILAVLLALATTIGYYLGGAGGDRPPDGAPQAAETPKPVMISGGVQRPGTYNLPEGRILTARQLIEVAGGVVPGLSQRVLVTDASGRPRADISWESLLALPEQHDVVLEPGDTVVLR